jgi:RNA polymerase sigma factor (sigma-70 family)
MSSGTPSAILRRFLRVAEQKRADQSDRDLLECFVTKKDEAAFAALMERHARLVFGVCRSVLNQEQDAEDAFQAAFLVLVHMASSIRKQESLASWLHGVALRTALKARRAMNTRRRKEPQAGTRTPEQPASEAAFRELQAILHEEVGRLTEKYRAPFVLCCLEGKSRVEAAQELGWKEGTVASRVAQARKLLESRLLQRGVALPAALTAAALAPADASAAVLAALSSVVARGAAAFAAGNVPESVSAGVVTLAQGVIQAMFVTKLKLITGIVLALALVLSGGGLLAYTARQSQERDPATVAPPKEVAEEKRTDALPPKAQEEKPALAAPAVNTDGEEGIIKEVGEKVPFNGTILVQRAKQGDIVYHVSKDTVIIHANLQKAAAADLKVGQRVRVQFSGPVAKSKPPQAEADQIVILGPLAPERLAGGAENSLESPLPHGAFIRLGSTRFRPGEMIGKLTFSPDGKKLITGGRASGGGISVWDPTSGKLILRRLLGEEAEISRDGERLFLIETLPSPPAKARDRPADRETVVGVTTEQPEVRNALKIYQLATGKLLQQIDGPGYLHRFAVTPDERTLALEYAIKNASAVPGDFTTGWLFRSRVELYDLKTGRVTHKLEELSQNYAGNGLTLFSADGKSLFAVGWSKENENRLESTVRRFDVATGALKSKRTIPGMYYRLPQGYHTPINSADRTLIASGPTLWDLDRGRLHWEAKGGDLQGAMTFLADGRTAIGWAAKEKPVVEGDPYTASKLVLWDVEANREIRRLPAHLSNTMISPDGKTFYGAAWTYRWTRYDFATGKEIESVDAPIAPPELIAFSPDGKYVVTQNNTFTADKNFDPARAYFVVRVWDRATGKCLHQIPTFQGNLLFFTPDGKTLVYGCGGVSSIFVLDTSTWKSTKRDFEPALPLVANFPIGLGATTCVLSPDGKVLATPNALWDWASGKLLGKIGHKYAGELIGQLGPIAFSPDSKQLACVASLPAPEVHLQVWNVADRKLRSDRVMTDWPKGLVWNPQLVADGKHLVAAWLPPRGPWRGMLRWPEEQDRPIPDDWPATMPPMPDAVVRIWDAATGKEKGRFEYSQNENMSDIPALFSPDGKLVVTANFHEEVVHFRDPASGKEVGRFRCRVKGVHSMSFSPDSQVLAVSAKDTTVLLVDVPKVVSPP